MQEFANLKVESRGKSLVITIADVSKELGTSASGKSTRVASTGGNVEIEGTNGLLLGLNAYRKAAK